MLERLPLRAATKAKISKALKGKPKSAAHKAKLSAALAGRPQAPGTKAALAKARASAPKPASDITKARHKATRKARVDQWRKDMYAAAGTVRDLVLLEDVRQSKGYKARRKLFDTTKRVSDGVGPPRKINRTEYYFKVQEYAYGLRRD